ncbi:hypothetical protein H340_12185 [Streptomyces mobaraensis NBRC 13819 = DSM 40847]|uniref:Uncharacterized protein n=1 Tax=Streptomyces mobaraensis (strain ATCC 29032 / DSM 40847 / JCM 4168 / NBRC 13819 / NCIMB 11159 / IPCR 16-22) TaxID=1223523 RepID=M3A559_STRM1|nr:hypothetical protein [Streptomyces mobaraensis]EMF00249.1 hypothetical protein H340_12185 [Streptomyces mobaraensis NBRC 13819 = DSM 40847]
MTEPADDAVDPERPRRRGDPAGERDSGPAETLAFVESPVQLLNVLEWAHARASAPPAPPPAPPPSPTGLLSVGVPRQTDRHTADRHTADRRPTDGTDTTPGADTTPGTDTTPGAHSTYGPPPTHDTVIVVLAPHDPMTRGQLRRMAELARAQGYRLRWEEARGGAGAPVQTIGGLAGPLRAARRVVIGDPFSRYVQLLLTLTRARELVVVDDGTATMEFVGQLARGERFVRWHRYRGGRGGWGARDVVFAPVSASARRMLTPNNRRSVELFTSMPVEPPPGVAVTANAFAWTRAAFGPPRLTRSTDLVGTSLVETGIVDAERYLEAVTALAGEHGATRYFAHRRENTDKLRLISGRLGLEVVRPELPLELIARRGPIGRTVLSFPSTVVHTLPLALAGTGVTVAVCDVDPGWLTAHASPRAEGFLSRVTGSARGVHRLPRMSARASTT